MADGSRRVFWCACVHAGVWFAGGDEVARKERQGVGELLQVRPMCRLKGEDVEACGRASACFTFSPATDPRAPVRVPARASKPQTLKRLKFKKINFGLHSLLRISETEAHPGTVP